MNRNSVRSRPIPAAPDCATSGSSAGSSRLACNSTATPSCVTERSGRSRASRCRSRANAATARRACAERRRRRAERHGAGGAVDHRQVARRQRGGEPDRAQHRRHAERAQHDRGVAVGAALVGDHAGDAGRLDQRRVGRAQCLGGQHRARGERGEIAERRARQVAHHAAGDLAHLLGAALLAGLVVGRHREQDGGDRLALLGDRGLGGDQALGDAQPRPAHQPRGAEHLHVGVEQRRDLGVRVLRQHGEARAQLDELAAGLRDRRLQPRGLGADIGGVDAVADDRLRRLDRAMHRADRDAGGDRDAGEAPLRPGRQLLLNRLH